MHTRLLMHIHVGCTDTGKPVDPFFRLHNHQVHIERLLADFGHGLDHWETKRDVGNEHTVHHIEMEHIGIAVVDHVDVARKVRKIGGEKRG